MWTPPQRAQRSHGANGAAVNFSGQTPAGNKRRSAAADAPLNCWKVGGHLTMVLSLCPPHTRTAPALKSTTFDLQKTKVLSYQHSPIVSPLLEELP